MYAFLKAAIINLVNEIEDYSSLKEILDFLCYLNMKGKY